MQEFLKFDINYFSILLLLFVLITMRIRNDAVSFSNRLFIKLIWINIYMLIMEIISWKFDRQPGQFNWYANYISNMIFSWSTPLITCVWVSYIDFHIYKSIERLKKRLYYFQPMIISTLFIIINFFRPFIFSVNDANVYSREPFVWLLVIINTFLVGYVWYMAYINRKFINKEVIISILLFIIMPAIAAAVQVLIFGAFILWPIMSITIVITYISLETVSTSKDYLTGLLSRHRLDNYIDYLIAAKKNFLLVMIDLDDFKVINDNYGHVKGDQALKIFSRNLSHTFKKANVIGRYAGDEFIIVTENLDENDISELMIQLNVHLMQEAERLELPFDIGFSYGYKRWEKSLDYDYETLLNLTDQEMYKKKKSKQIKISMNLK